MPRTRSLAWSELKIGLLALAALFVAGALIFALGGEGGFFATRYDLRVRFPNVAGIKAGSPVRVAGVEVGRVTSVQFVGAEVEVAFELLESMRQQVRTASVATIGSVSLLGEGAIDVTATTEGTPLPNGGYVTFSGSLGGLGDVTTQAAGMLEQAGDLVTGIQAGEGTVGRLLTDEALYEELRDMAGAASSVMRNLESGRGSIGRLMSDPTMAQQLEASLTNLSAVTGRLREGEEGLGRLLNDDEFARTLTETTRNFQILSARLTEGEGTAGKLLTDDELYTRLSGLAGRFEDVAARLSDGDGTAGLLLNDAQLYENMNEVVGEVRSLLADIRADPKKFLSMKVSIF